MTAGANNGEVAAIETAFRLHVQGLYDILTRNLVTSMMPERSAVEAFTKGLDIARRTRELAFSAVGANPAAAVTVATADVGMDTAKPRTKKSTRKPRA